MATADCPPTHRADSRSSWPGDVTAWPLLRRPQRASRPHACDLLTENHVLNRFLPDVLVYCLDALLSGADPVLPSCWAPRPRDLQADDGRDWSQSTLCWCLVYGPLAEPSHAVRRPFAEWCHDLADLRRSAGRFGPLALLRATLRGLRHEWLLDDRSDVSV